MHKLTTQGKLSLNIPEFDARQTFTCGQAFRWDEQDDGGWLGVVGGKQVLLTQNADEVTIFGDDDGAFWRNYLAVDINYNKINAAFENDDTLSKAVAFAPGIRVLRQPFFEALITFIISSNNNIPRIKGIVQRLCAAFGQDMGGYHAFPTAEVLAQATEADFEVLRAGFRVRYIMDAAKKVADGAVGEQQLQALANDDAKEVLMSIKGVGPKVANCVLLYGLGRQDIVPKDVWMNKALATYYPDGLPQCCAGYEGVAQQFIFNYARTMLKLKNI